MSKDSTAIDLLPVKEVSEQKLRNFDLSKHLVKLLWDEPFYSRILRSITKIESEDIPTAGVLATPDDIKFWWNRRFLASLKEEEVKGLLKHECLHLILSHTTSRKKDPHLVWNYGTDLAINSLIPQNQLPEGGLIPGESLQDLTAEDKERMSEDQIETYNKLSKQIQSFPRNKTAEFYFERLKEEGHVEELSGDGEGEFVFGFDDHGEWGESGPEMSEITKNKIKEILKDAIEEANNKGWGSVSTEMRSELNNLVVKPLDWKGILSRFCGFSRRMDKQSTNKRLNRKYPNIHSGHRNDYKPLIAVYVDESGSITSTELEEIYGQLNILSKKSDFYLYKFDSEVDDKNGFLWKKGKTLNLNRSLNGGTSFSAVTAHALKRKNMFDGYIIITDGCAAKPPISRGLKRCWLLLKNYSLLFEKDKSDVLVEIK